MYDPRSSERAERIHNSVPHVEDNGSKDDNSVHAKIPDNPVSIAWKGGEPHSRGSIDALWISFCILTGPVSQPPHPEKVSGQGKTYSKSELCPKQEWMCATKASNEEQV